MARKLRIGYPGAVYHVMSRGFEGREIFFDARDDEQLEYVLNSYNDSEIKPVLILTGGSPIEIEEKYQIDAYFDQKGLLIKKFGIRQVPAVIAQDGKVLNIREVKVD